MENDPTGEGYYELSFSSLEDLRSVWAVGAWHLNLGLLRLSQWTPDFQVNRQKQTHVQCWVRIHDLPQEYWRTKLLFEIAGGLGSPISLDESTRNRVLGHFARVLVDVDLSARLPSEILVERDGYAFFVGIEYERLPDFCTHYQTIGHPLANCNNKSGQEGKKLRQQYVPKGRFVNPMHEQPQSDKQVVEGEATQVVAVPENPSIPGGSPIHEVSNIDVNTGVGLEDSESVETIFDESSNIEALLLKQLLDMIWELRFWR